MSASKALCLTAGVCFVAALAATTAAHAADYYDCFDPVSGCARPLTGDTLCVPGATNDYDVTRSDRSADVTVLSFHGGRIEANTSTISAELANRYGWNRYDFNAHARTSCLSGMTNYERLHITAINYNDDAALGLVGAHPRAVAIHGHGRDAITNTICVGGRDATRRQAFRDYVASHSAELGGYNLQTVDAPTDTSGVCAGIEGTSTSNLVNRTQSAMGVQLEMGYQVRADLVNTGNSAFNGLRNVFYGAVAAAMGAGGGGGSLAECSAFTRDAGTINEVTAGTDTACTGGTPAFHVADQTTATSGAYYAWIGAATGTVSFPVNASAASVTSLSVSLRVYGDTASGETTVQARTTSGNWVSLGTMTSPGVPDWQFHTVTYALTPLSSYVPAGASSFTVQIRVVTNASVSEMDIDRVYLSVNGGAASGGGGSGSATYPLHTGITATWFYVGEPAGPSNDWIANDMSAWDDAWRLHYTGSSSASVFDYPSPTRVAPNYYPAGYTPRENPFYIALPYNDFSGGAPRPDRAAVVPWSGSRVYGPNESMVKNRWVRIVFGTRVAFAQWEDVGPNLTNDSAYVFGTAAPSNTFGVHAGIDVSPAVRDFLGMGDVGTVSWQFVEEADVPAGPWRNVITTRNICWGCGG